MTDSKLKPKKFWIDTDCGVDDAHAILIALAQPDVEIVGISTCVGNTSAAQAARNVLRVLKTADRLEIPVYTGVDKFLLGTNTDGSYFHGHDGLGDTPDTDDDPGSDLVQQEHAVTALARVLREHSGEITVLALAPLTNLALAQRLDPELSSRMRRCVIMGGNYAAQGNVTLSAEFNFYCDPEAAHVVLREFTCPVTLCGWETCKQCYIPWDTFHGLGALGTKKSNLIRDITRYSVEHYYSNVKSDGFEIADQVAAMVAVEPDIVTSSKWRAVQVELTGKHCRGLVLVDWEDTHLTGHNKIEIVLKLDQERALKMQTECLR